MPISGRTTSLLEVRNIVVEYGGVRALHDVSVHVPERGVLAVIGANGAGKSTLLKTMAGLVHQKSGTVLLEGQDISALRPHARLDRGIVLCPEGRRLFPDLTVLENIRMGAYRLRDRAEFRRRLARLHDSFPRIAERAGQIASSLSGGEQQMVAIARALISHPRVLMLDEPTLGLAPKMIHEVARLVRSFRDEGITIVIVEQNAKLALRISDQAVVLETGHVALAGPSAELISSKEVQNSYLGG
ncbi:MAG: ABC transporter ATP-binding protein, partial [Rhodospirillales bacterium]|nr:ABC transporter ATP-binding protein [Rhodospirillales bacterium]